MKRMNFKHITLVALVCFQLLPATGHASPMTYTPVNPSFGGDPFNGATLLNEANVQKQFQAPRAASSASSQQNFSNTITTALLGQISTKIANAIYGPDAQDSGTFLIGTTKVDFNHDSGQVKITITDLGTGQITNVEVPAGI